MSEQLFISDLHLSADRPQTIALFEQFLLTRPQSGDRLYILGDLFDSWVGDDDDAPLARRIRNALKACSNRGVELFIQRGNRDFLMGRRMMKETGATLLEDPVLVDVAGLPTLLMHGDLLCTDDIDYQRARKKLRNPLVQWLALRKSLDARRAMAADYRRRSGEATAAKAENIMDANVDTVLNYLQQQHAQQIIHGHTHRPAIHRHQLDDGSRCIRHVLPEWHKDHAQVLVDNGSALRYEDINS